MKNKYNYLVMLFIAAFLSLSVNVTAQTKKTTKSVKKTEAPASVFTQEKKPTFTYGGKIGMNISNMSNFNDTEGKVGLVLGAFGNIRFNQEAEATLLIELLYSQQGCKIKNEDMFIRLNYLNIPLLVNWEFKSLAFKTGIQPGVLLSSDVEIADVTISATGNKFKKLDFSIPVGISYEMSFGLLLELRATLGIIGVLGDDWGDNSTMNNFSSKNLVTQFTIGYRF